MLDPEKLLAYPLPPIRQTLTKRETILYALSIGLGQDPLDQNQLPFVVGPQKAVPSMAVILAYPGFWLADPATSVDAVRLVHGEQAIELHCPIPTEGQFIGQTRITGLVDKGAGKGALLYTEKRLTDAHTNTLIATATATTFLRGDGGFASGGAGLPTPASPTEPPRRIPDTPPDHVIDLETRPEQALLYRLLGDENPLHADPAAAQTAGFPRPILHGLCTFGVITHAILRGLCAYQPALLRAVSLRFSAPVFPGETIRTEIHANGSFRARVPARDVTVVTNGKAVIR